MLSVGKTMKRILNRIEELDLDKETFQQLRKIVLDELNDLIRNSKIEDQTKDQTQNRFKSYAAHHTRLSTKKP